MQPTVSVVVVSRERPESLLWCLTALAGVRFDAFEIVVVADEAGYSAVLETDFARKVKLVRFDEANISAARNKGVAQAAGEIVAFIDDDAAAEPMWLAQLASAFADPDVACAGGYVRGRNGISYQWKARQVNEEGSAIALDNGGLEPFSPGVRDGYAVKTEGTNMALRRAALCAQGGFDEAFHFFLDETDLNLRLHQKGHKTVLVPRAEVHHAYAASTRRRDDRAVTDLHDVGASTVVLLRKFNKPLEPRCSEMAAEQVQRLEDQRSRGLLSAEEADAALKTLEAGFEEGKDRAFGQYPNGLDTPMAGFLPFKPNRSSSETLAGRWHKRRALRREAAELAAQGFNVSLYLFSPDTRFHHVRFDEAGFWEQSGGQLGKSERHQPLFQLISFRKRLLKEQNRVAHARG